MRTFVQKPKGSQQTSPTKSTKPSRSLLEQSSNVQSVLHLQRTIGNQGVLRLLQTETENTNSSSASISSTGFAHDLSRISVYPGTCDSIQPKLKVNSRGDRHEQEADRIADEVLRQNMPTKEDEKVQIKERASLQAENGECEVNEDIKNQLNRSKGGGNPISDQIRAFVEPRLQSDFSKVRVHTNNEADQMSRDLGARAFTFGRDIYFGAGQYSPDSYEGKRLLVHELTHVVQQKSTSSIQRAPIIISGRQFMEGDVVLNQASRRDILRHGNLFPGHDQAHIAVTSNRKLAYEISYSNPEDPFRWNILKSIIDNHHVQIFAVGFSDTFNVKEITISQGNRAQVIRPVTLSMVTGSGITLPTESQQLSINPQADRMLASTSNTYHQVYYETGAGGRGMLGSNSLAHELFGHLWLALQGVHYRHGRSLAGTSNITDPLGRQFTGSVDDYIDSFAGASYTSVLQSPTFNVSPQYLLSTIQWIERQGASHISTQGNGGIDADLDLKWQALSNNYDILMINSRIGVRISQSLTLTASSVVTRMVAWINRLPANKKTAFINVLRAITQSIRANRRAGLSSAVLHRI